MLLATIYLLLVFLKLSPTDGFPTIQWPAYFKKVILSMPYPKPFKASSLKALQKPVGALQFAPVPSYPPATLLS